MHPEAYNLVPPSRKRPGVWLGGVLQIHVGRACDLACFGCSQGSNLAGKLEFLTPAEFEQIVDSMDGYFGVYGVFGGNPALSPYFEDYCRILRAKVPFERRGLWCNNLRGKGAHARITFAPHRSNLNVHIDSEAAEEFRRDWPESAPYLKGEQEDSQHGSPWVAIKDVIADEDERWRLIGSCDISKWWSGIAGKIPGRGLRAYFCEIAFAQANLHATTSDAADWPDVGHEVKPGWWRQPIEAYEAQINQHCLSCGIPLRRPGQLAIRGDHEEFSEIHRHIARPKIKGRPVQIVESIGVVERPNRPSTEYLPGTTPRQRA